jgi:hypothetical protein
MPPKAPKTSKTPKTPSPPSAVADYWRHETPPFPIEDIQRFNSSPIHYLLSAFVNARPDSKPDDSAQPEFLPVHMLLSQIDDDDYLR